MSEWQPIETAPADVDVLMGYWQEWPERKWVYVLDYAQDTKGHWLKNHVTHWMPLPEPPL
jgi:hypothetical protein